MMATKAIARDSAVPDPFYRYKRESVVLSPVKQHHQWLNLSGIAKSLDVPESALSGYIQTRLGVPIQKGVIKSKTLSLNVDALVDEFVDKFVLCNVCDLPELTRRGFTARCRSCGNLMMYSVNKESKWMDTK